MTDAKITIGFDKDGEADFEIGLLKDLTVERMNELRAMVMVAIGVAEDQFRMWNNLSHPAAEKSK